MSRKKLQNNQDGAAWSALRVEKQMLVENLFIELHRLSMDKKKGVQDTWIHVLYLLWETR